MPHTSCSYNMYTAFGLAAGVLKYFFSFVNSIQDLEVRIRIDANQLVERSGMHMGPVL